jgi:uncharacterized membrane protein YebE (DUF533 family)
MRAACLLAAAASLGLAGCQSSSIGGATGAVVGTVSGAATANPVAGYAIGVTVQAAVDATVKYVLREWKNDQQNVMANAAGSRWCATSTRRWPAAAKSCSRWSRTTLPRPPMPA